MNFQGGQRQLLQFLVAVTKPNTSLLILDEPFSNLHDTLDKSIVRILNSIKKEKIVLLVTHRTIDRWNRYTKCADNIERTNKQSQEIVDSRVDDYSRKIES